MLNHSLLAKSSGLLSMQLQLLRSISASHGLCGFGIANRFGLEARFEFGDFLVSDLCKGGVYFFTSHPSTFLFRFWSDQRQAKARIRQDSFPLSRLADAAIHCHGLFPLQSKRRRYLRWCLALSWPVLCLWQISDGMSPEKRRLLDQGIVGFRLRSIWRRWYFQLLRGP